MHAPAPVIQAKIKPARSRQVEQGGITYNYSISQKDLEEVNIFHKKS